MWKCKECGEMNGDTSMYCASCGEARLVPRAQGTGQQAAADAGSSEQRKYIPCQEANALYRWAETLWRICRIAAVLLLVVPVISYRLNEANEMTLRIFSSLYRQLDAWSGGTPSSSYWKPWL